MEFRLSSESARRGKLQLYSGLLDELALGGVREKAVCEEENTGDNGLPSVTNGTPTVAFATRDSEKSHWFGIASCCSQLSYTCRSVLAHAQFRGLIHDARNDCAHLVEGDCAFTTE